MELTEEAKAILEELLNNDDFVTFINNVSNKNKYNINIKIAIEKEEH